jgi:hypothetical protein
MNKLLLLFDIIFLPVTLVRLLLIYLWGSKYNVPNMSFLDVMMHADHPYFNQEGEMLVDTTNNDIRCVIYENSKLILVNPDQISSNQQDEIPNSIQKQVSNDAQKQISNDVQKQISNDVQKQISNDVQKQISKYSDDDRMGVDIFGKKDEYSPSNNLMTELESDSSESLDTDAEDSPPVTYADTDDQKRAQIGNAKFLENRNLSDINGMINKVWNELDLDSDN